MQHYNKPDIDGIECYTDMLYLLGYTLPLQNHTQWLLWWNANHNVVRRQHLRAIEKPVFQWAQRSINKPVLKQKLTCCTESGLTI